MSIGHRQKSAVISLKRSSILSFTSSGQSIANPLYNQYTGQCSKSLIPTAMLSTVLWDTGIRTFACSPNVFKINEANIQNKDGIHIFHFLKVVQKK